MNKIFKKHFIYFNESINDLTLESFAVKSLGRKGRIIFVDKIKSSEECLKSFSMINKRSFGRTNFKESDSYLDILSSSMESEILFLRHYSDFEREEDIKHLFQILCDERLTQSIVLINFGDCLFSAKEFEELSECLYEKDCQLGIRTDDVSFLRQIKKTKDIIFYKSAKNINLL